MRVAHRDQLLTFVGDLLLPRPQHIESPDLHCVVVLQSLPHEVLPQRQVGVAKETQTLAERRQAIAEKARRRTDLDGELHMVLQALKKRRRRPILAR